MWSTKVFCVLLVHGITQFPQCSGTAAPQCKHPGRVPDGWVEFDNGYNVSSRARTVCNSDFFASSNDTAVCIAVSPTRAEWDQSLPTCEFRCQRSDYTWDHALTRCVKTYRKKVDWPTAHQACLRDNAMLLRVDSHAAISATIRDYKNFQFWIGLNDVRREEVWEWTDGGRLGVSNFQKGEPNGDTRENCVISTPGYWWQDYPCHYQFAYVCEMQACHPGAFISSGKCIKYFRQPLSWTHALLACQQWGGGLLEITDATTDTEVVNNMRENGYANSAWIGLSDEDQDDQWKWWPLQPTTVHQYTNWDLESVAGNGSCATIRTSNSWVAEDCQSRRPFYCQTERTKCARGPTNPAASRVYKTASGSYNYTCAPGYVRNSSSLAVCDKLGYWRADDCAHQFQSLAARLEGYKYDPVFDSYLKFLDTKMNQTNAVKACARDHARLIEVKTARQQYELYSPKWISKTFWIGYQRFPAGGMFPTVQWRWLSDPLSPVGFTAWKGRHPFGFPTRGCTARRAYKLGWNSWTCSKEILPLCEIAPTDNNFNLNHHHCHEPMDAEVVFIRTSGLSYERARAVCRYLNSDLPTLRENPCVNELFTSQLFYKQLKASWLRDEVDGGTNAYVSSWDASSRENRLQWRSKSDRIAFMCVRDDATNGTTTI